MLTRRAFLAAGTSTVALLGALSHAQVTRAQGIAVTRRSVRGMAANDPDLAALRRAVTAMRALSGSDPRNWNRFADIHRTHCPHSNWYFLPWHRAYLVAFERIVRQLGNKPDFALPYWDWTADRQVPAAFAENNGNPLYHPRPGLGRGRLADDMVGPSVIARILSAPDFEAFGSTRPRGQNGAGREWQRRSGTRTELEFNPHDGVHTTLGGSMSQVDVASRDPIFFLHHANVDRLWAMWNARGNRNSREANWRNLQFSGQFFNPDGSAWNTTVDEVQSTPALGYRYDGELLGMQFDDPMEAFAADPVLAQSTPPVRAPAADDRRAGVLLDYRRMPDDVLPRGSRDLRRVTAPSGRTFLMAGHDNDQRASRERPVGIPVAFGRPLAEVVHADAIAASRSPEPGTQPRLNVWAVIRDIEPPTDAATRVRVFVNCGDLAPTTPVTDQSYVTTLSFFGGRHAGHDAAGHSGHRHHTMQSSGIASGTCACVDLGPALARMSSAQPLAGDRVVVQLVPVGGDGNPAGSTVRPRRVEIVII